MKPIEPAPTPAPPLPKPPTRPVQSKPKPTPPVQSKPKPTPTPPVQMPQPLPLPTPSLPAQPPAPVPPPIPAPVPPAPPVQTMPVPPFVQHMHPMIGIPCGWMPIFDADCYPFMHSGQIQAMPQPTPPAFEQPAPLPSTQFPMQEESSLFPSRGPATEPVPFPLPTPMIDGWQLIESPDHLFEESPNLDLEPAAWCPPEQSYIPQAISPAYQQDLPMMPYPSFHHGCGCGGQQPYQQQPMMMMPMYYGPLCNCHSSMQPTPYQMMPTYQGTNWYGSY